MAAQHVGRPAQDDVPEVLGPAAQQARSVPVRSHRAVHDEQGATRGRRDHLELPQLRLAR